MCTSRGGWEAIKRKGTNTCMYRSPSKLYQDSLRTSITATAIASVQTIRKRSGPQEKQRLLLY